MSRWEAVYGNIYGYFIGTRPILVVKDLDALKTLLVADSHLHQNRPKTAVSAKPLNDTVAGLRGKRWKEVRSMLTPTFSASKMKNMMTSMEKALTKTIHILEETTDSPAQIVDAYELFQGLTCEVISSCALAMEVNSQTNKKDEFLTAVRGFLKTAMSPVITLALCFPSFANLLTVVVENFSISGKMTRMIIHHVERVIATRRKEQDNNWLVAKNQTIGAINKSAGFISSSSTSENENSSPEGKQRKPTDVLQMMMDVAKQPPLSGIPKLTDDEIVANSWVFVLGGFETTAAALTFISYLLAKHGNVQDRLHQELRNALAVSFFGSNGLMY